MTTSALLAALSCALVQVSETSQSPSPERPNILFCIADDWGWPHAGALGDRVIQTPSFDRLAREGVLFERAFVSSPSCTPSRNAILTGQLHWRLAEGANLHSTLGRHHPVYPLLLAEAGYHVGHWRKSFGPGRLGPGGYTDAHPVGQRYEEGFSQFLEQRPEGSPFCFWLGAYDPHRGYQPGTGAAAGMDLDEIQVPGFWPDEPRVRSDIADYYFEVQRFDREVGEALALLEERGELEDTIVVMTGDHGMPFPRCKSNLYEMGVRVPLAVRWGAKVPGDRRVTDFVSLTDLAPTFLELAGLGIPASMTGRSLAGTLTSSKTGRVEASRDHVVFGKERHVPCQQLPSMAGYPCRAIRVDGWLYIHNFAPDLWPAGIGDADQAPMGWAYSDCDDGPTKTAVLDLEQDDEGGRFYRWCFAKRPAEELFDLSADPDQLVNLAGDPAHETRVSALRERLMARLEATGDPRALGGAEVFETYPYYGGSRRKK